MSKEQWTQIIYTHAIARSNEKGLRFNSLSLKEQYQLMYEVSLDLLCELGGEK